MIKAEKGELRLPLERQEEFIGIMQKNNRVQVPVLIRWKHRLEPSEILHIYVYHAKEYKDETFYVRLSRDGRFTIPSKVAKRINVKPGDVLKVTLYPEINHTDE